MCLPLHASPEPKQLVGQKFGHSTCLLVPGRPGKCLELLGAKGAQGAVGPRSSLEAKGLGGSLQRTELWSWVPRLQTSKPHKRCRKWWSKKPATVTGMAEQVTPNRVSERISAGPMQQRGWAQGRGMGRHKNSLSTFSEQSQ